jgi:exopolysaccharide production protein ExoZ
VDVFFVISGFIIAWIAVLGRTAPESPGKFAIRRLCRIAPPYWVLTAVHVYFLHRVGLSDFLKSLAFLPIAVEEAPYLGEAALYVGWSLNYEVFFYAVCAVGLLAGKRALAVVASVLVFTTVALPLWRFGYVDPDPHHLYPFASPYAAMAANPLIIEFLFGCGAAWLYARLRHRLTPASALALLAAGVAAFGGSVVAVEAKFSLPWQGLPAALLLFGAVAAERTGLLRVPRWSVFLGEISYGLYLVHPSVIETVRRLAGPIAPDAIHLQFVKFAVDLGFALLLAAWVHRYLELPSIALGKRLTKGIRRRHEHFGILARESLAGLIKEAIVEQRWSRR